MAIITIFSSPFCHGEDIAEKLAQDLKYGIISNKLPEETSNRFNIDIEKINETLQGHSAFFNNITHEKERNITYVRATLAEMIKKDNLIYHGMATHLLPMEITHILKVCITANSDFRSELAMKELGISKKEAQAIIEKEDQKCFDWTQHLFEKSPWDEGLYDIVIPIHSSSVKEAVSIIQKNLQKKALATTKESLKALDDFILSTKVDLALMEKGHFQEVTCKNGEITITINKNVIMLKRLQDKLHKIVSDLPGVKKVDISLGANVYNHSRYDELTAIPKPKVLLVDDEREFVQTLSERLKARDMDSTVVYDGEEALTQIEKDEPEVMILDLKMPGVDGLEVLRKVKEERSHVEVIILTGHGSEKDQALAMELGAFAYLEKPVDIEVLSQKMKEAYEKIRGE